MKFSKMIFTDFSVSKQWTLNEQKQRTIHPCSPLTPPLIAYASFKPFLYSNSATCMDLPSKLPYTQKEKQLMNFANAYNIW